jgi:pimeloyl-ACP methyl ester carboxylesterase
MVDQPGFGRSDKPPVAGNYFTFLPEVVDTLLAWPRHADWM